MVYLYIEGFMKRFSILIFFFLSTFVFGQNKYSLRAGIGDSFNVTMTHDQITSKPKFTICNVYSPKDNISAHIIELTLVIKSSTFTNKYELKQQVIKSENRLEKDIFKDPVLSINHLEIIKKLKPGDTIILKDVKIVGSMCPQTLKETKITIVQ